LDNLNIEIKNKILAFLKDKKYGASSSEIAKSIGHNRITVTKYLEIMRANKLLSFDVVAQAKLWHIAQKDDRKRILVVDDEPHVVDLIRLSLASKYYDVVGAYSGFEALEKVKQDAPDIIILDLMMPGINGYEVCNRLKENALTQHIPILILSAKGELADKLKGIKLGADDYMTKPFDPLELEAKINFMLREEDSSFHHLTNLPSRKLLKDELEKRMKQRQDFTVLTFEMKDLRQIADHYGTKRRDGLLKMFSKLLSDRANSASFLAHTPKDKFIIMTQDKSLEQDIMISFSKMLPYICHGIDIKKHKLSLTISRLQSQELRKKSLTPELALAKIE
jgi:DNA-binding response OmpR family regulator